MPTMGFNRLPQKDAAPANSSSVTLKYVLPIGAQICPRWGAKTFNRIKQIV
jgi:hypothetical protein